MHRLTGYTDRWSVKPGESIRFMISSAAGAPFTLRFARHLCADPNPAGPGYREVAMPTSLDGEHPGLEQMAVLGSYGAATGLPVNPAQGLTLSATIWPTLPNERQGVLSLSGPGCRVSLGLDAGGAFAELALPDGSVTRASTGVALLTRRGTTSPPRSVPDGILTVSQRPHHALARCAMRARPAHRPPCRLPACSMRIWPCCRAAKGITTASSSARRSASAPTFTPAGISPATSTAIPPPTSGRTPATRRSTTCRPAP